MLLKLEELQDKQIKKALDELRQNQYTGKDLQEGLFRFKSLRIKKYRVLYRIGEEEDFLGIYYIGQRSDVYEQFRRLLAELQKGPPILR